MASDPIKIVGTSSSTIADPVRLVSITQTAANMIANAINFVVGLVIGDLVFVVSENQFPAPIAGNITPVAGKHYFIVARVEVNANFIDVDDVEFSGSANHALIQNVSGTFFTSANIQKRFSIDRLNVESNTGGILFNIATVSGGALSELFITDPEIFAFDDLGTITGLNNGLTIRTTIPVNYTTGLVVSDCASVSIANSAIITAGNGTFLTINLRTEQSVTINNVYVIESGLTHSLLNLIEGGAIDYRTDISHNDPGPGVFLAAGSEDQTNIFNNFAFNGKIQNSKSVASYFVTGNALATPITGSGTLDDLNLGTVTSGNNLERWSIVDTATGEVQYNGLKAFSGELIFTFGGLKSGGATLYDFSLVKSLDNASPLDPIQNVIEPVEFQTVHKNGTLLVPVTAVTGDMIKIQVEQEPGSPNNITVSHASFAAR